MRSESEEDMDEVQDTVEADGELQIITEVWVEPEWGTVINSTPERKHFDGLMGKELAQAVSTSHEWSHRNSDVTLDSL